MKVTRSLKISNQEFEGLKGSDTFANMLQNKLHIEDDDINSLIDVLEQVVSYGNYYYTKTSDTSVDVYFGNINDMVQFLNMQQGIQPQLNPMAEALSINIDNVSKQQK